MTVSPLHTSRHTGQRLVGAGASRPRLPPSARGIARRRILVRWSKRLLPVLALALLATVALWPEIDREQDAGRIAYRRGLVADPEAGQIVDVHYRGVDERNRPYTVTADTAVQVTPERVNLTKPKGDVTMGDGSWLMLSSDKGVFIQHRNLLDLSGDVVLYRDDGTTMYSPTATMDLKAGVAAGSDGTHAEGPFGTLDAQGYAIADKGSTIQFAGPARLVMNGAQSSSVAATSVPAATSSPPAPAQLTAKLQ